MDDPSDEFILLDRQSTIEMLLTVINGLDDNLIKGITYILTSRYKPELLENLEAETEADTEEADSEETQPEGVQLEEADPQEAEAEYMLYAPKPRYPRR